MKTNHANWDYHNTRVEMAEKEACFLEEGAAAFLEKYAAALDALRIADPNWEAWYNARPEQTCGEMLPLIRARTAELTDPRTELERDLDWLADGEELQETRRLVGV